MFGGRRRRMIREPPSLVLADGQRIRAITGPLTGSCGRLVKRMGEKWCVDLDCLPEGVYVIMAGDSLVTDN